MGIPGTTECRHSFHYTGIHNEPQIFPPGRFPADSIPRITCPPMSIPVLTHEVLRKVPLTWGNNLNLQTSPHSCYVPLTTKTSRPRKLIRSRINEHGISQPTLRSVYSVGTSRTQLFGEPGHQHQQTSRCLGESVTNPLPFWLLKPLPL